jgi:hypothetical protein
MVINDSPKGEGYIACMNGLPLTSNPYMGINGDIICRWYEWSEGWHKAYADGKFGWNV